MEFIFTPEEAQPIALTMARLLAREQWKIAAEESIHPDAPYVTTLKCTKLGLTKLIDAQGVFDYHRELRDLATWLSAQRSYSELFVAVMKSAVISAEALDQMRRDGVGLLLVDKDGAVTSHQPAHNPALKVNPDPTLKYSNRRQEVLNAIQKFNEVNRKDGLRDLCEIVERETERLAVLASRRRLILPDELQVTRMKWDHQINTLASAAQYTPGGVPLFSPAFATDMHSFRDARNLVDHKVKGKRQDIKREKQYADKMMQGPRLVAELIALQRSIR